MPLLLRPAATALALLLAGPAWGEIILSGSAEMGLAGGNRGDTSATRFHQDIDLDVTFTGRTDSGLTFGATIDLGEMTKPGRRHPGRGAAITLSGPAAR